MKQKTFSRAFIRNPVKQEGQNSAIINNDLFCFSPPLPQNGQECGNRKPVSEIMSDHPTGTFEVSPPVSK